MIPESSIAVDTITQEDSTLQPSKTYKIDLTSMRILGKVDELEALTQSIKKILSTDRYFYEIYDGNYGVEILKLIGKNYSYIVSELPRIIREALLQDDRVLGIENVVITRKSIDSCEASFSVNTVFGNMHFDTEVPI